MSGIYVHFPFCKKKCVYCNFYSVSRTDLKTQYIDALSQEIGLRAKELGDDIVETLYFGGGTPSLCTIKELETVVEKLHSTFTFSKELEFTVEANPEQLTPEYLRDLKGLGVNRLSIGIQSFDDCILTLLGRTHSAVTAQTAIENAFASGFNNVSLDLIYGIAARVKGLWEKELEKAFSYPITHLSAYSLTVEENTLLHKKIKNGTMPPIDEECAVNDYWSLMEAVERHGFKQYEISNFARDGKISQHNSSYWAHTPYLGLGAAAHSFNGSARSWNTADVKRYISGCKNGAPPREYEALTDKELYNEYILLRLRTSAGINLSELQQRFGANRRNKAEKFLTALSPSLFIYDGNTIALTAAGKLHADNFAMELFETE